MSKDFIDPYVYPGTDVLVDNYCVHDQNKLSELEKASSFTGRISLQDEGPPKKLDLNYLRHIHKQLFGNVYGWAGDLRTVEINKRGSQFHPSSMLQGAFDYILDWMQNESALLDPGVDDETFIKQASYLLSEINYIHPFREGNGRTQRAFLDAVAAKSGRKLAWRNVSNETYTQASVESFQAGKGDAFEPVFAEITKEPFDGKLILDEGQYVSAAPGSLRLDPDLAPGRRRNMFGPGICGVNTTKGNPCQRKGKCPYHG